MQVSCKRTALEALLKRQSTPITEAQQAAATQLGIDTAALHPPPQQQSIITDAEALSIEQENVPPKPYMHSGSSRPHAQEGDAASFQRADTWAPAGSLRQLEPESTEVLRREAMPLTNVPRRSDPEEPPPRITNPPGPFTTAQLIPQPAIEGVTNHHQQVASMLARAGRGEQGWRHAKRLRPQALILEEHEALNECGRGHVWAKRADEDMWDVVQPSSWPLDPPSCTLDPEQFERLADRCGLVDKRVVSRMYHGFPGATNMPSGRAVVAFPHMGALKNVAAYADMNQRDIDNGYVSHSQPFPEIWPTTVDPMNIVVQHGKPRLTIDKTMKLSSDSPPEPVDAYNDYIDVDTDRERHGPFVLPRVWQLSRAAAILATAGVEIKLGKFDLSTYFRCHGKQRAHVHQSGRLFASGYGHDYRVNFGERDAMDNTCDASNALALFVRHELRRLDSEYPSRVQSVIDWLHLRLGLAREAGEETDDNYVWLALFFFLYFVDDAGLAVIDDLLYDQQGEPKIVLITNADGSISRVHQHRSTLYFEASMGIVQSINHETPLKKQSPMALLLEYLGVDLHGVPQERRLSSTKRKLYRECISSLRGLSRRMPNGTTAVSRGELNSLVHKLLHASEVIPLMRAHLFYLRQALKIPNALDWDAAILTQRALSELEWCDAQLAKSADVGIPFATRYSFPSSSDTTLVRYHDASREPDKPASHSGFGAWCVVRKTFIYIEGRWSSHEVNSYSINVLETHAKDMFAAVAIPHVRSMGGAVTHSLAFVDNTTAQHVPENGRTQVAAINELNLRRQQLITSLEVHEATERVASVDNDVADLLSRGDIEEALRFPRYYNLETVQLSIPTSIRDLSAIPATWA